MAQCVRERDKQPKKVFNSQVEAEQWLEQRRRNYRGDSFYPLSVYRCLGCQNWHVGSTRSGNDHRQNRYHEQWTQDRETMRIELGDRVMVAIEKENARAGSVKTTQKKRAKVLRKRLQETY